MKRIVLLASVLWASTLSGAIALYDFEGEVATGFTGGYTSLSITDTGLTATFTREGGTAFDIVENVLGQAGKPPGWALKSLHPFFATGPFHFLVDFSQGIMGASIESGDYGADSDTITLEAWSGPGGTGVLLDSDTVILGGAGFPVFASVGVMDGGIGSLKLIGGSTGFPASVFWDNLEVEFVVIPEPSSLLLIAGGAALLALGRFRRS